VEADRESAGEVKHEVTPGWREVHVGTEADGLEINGVDVWKATWRSLDRCVWLPHPQWPRQIHDYVVYEIAEGMRKTVFAAAELSNGCWGFYVPEAK
jgi:hypothetical protein